MALRFAFDCLFRRERLDRSLEEEIQFHIAERAADLQRSGVPREEAERRAHLEFGGPEKYKEECRETRRFHGLHGWFTDVRFGLRMLRRSPGFSILAMLCLTLGIGTNAAVFSWIEGTLLRPYPAVANQESLLVLAGNARGVPGYNGVSWPDFLDFQRNCTLLGPLIAEKITGATLSIGDRAERATGSVVSANYFDALGIRPILGRGFQPGEDVGRNAHPVTVISYKMWQDRFHGDREIIGRTQVFNRVPFTIVGVAPQGFYGTFVGYAWDFWAPVSMQETFESTGYKLEDRGERWIEGFARLKPGVTAAQAQQEIAAVASRLERQYPDTNRGHGIQLLRLWQSPFNGTDALLPTLGVSLAVVLFVLLIACANVGNLLLVRSVARRQEMTVRLAVGAARARLIRQLLTEGLVLGALAAMGGLLIAHWCRHLLILLMPFRSAPVFVAGNIDWRVLGMSAGVSILATLLFGLFPALHASKVDIAGALKCESAVVVGGQSKSWLRSGLVLVQVALSFVLLVSSGLLLRSLWRIRDTSPGFSRRGILVSAINLFGAGYDKPRARNFQDQLMDRIQTLSGIESAAYARVIPFSYMPFNSAPIAVDGYQPAPDEAPAAEYDEVGPRYFATLDLPLVSGREFTPADDENALPVAIVNEAMVAQYWRGADPVGRRLEVNGRWMRVVGVARNAKYNSMTEPLRPFFYVALRQNPSTLVQLVLRTPQDIGALSTALAREIHAIDPDLGVSAVLTLGEHLDRKNFGQRIAGVLLAAFGGLALLLATIGLYGVMSYAVSQSRRELGLRMALGAAPSQLMRLVMSRGIALTAVGIVAGAAAALALTRLLGYLLYQVSPHDPLSFGTAFVAVTIAALPACLLPAWRATRTDPSGVLRE